MYDYIKGHLASKQPHSYRGNCIAVENAGIGYLIFTGSRTIEKLNDNQEVKIYVSLLHKEDSMALTGFLTKEERDIFNILQSVSGIGVKTALTIMDEFTAAELVNIMITEDSKELSRAKGVGAKAAQKIILELKDKLINWSNKTPADISSADNPADISRETAHEVQNVLVSLGYSTDEIKSALKHAASSSDNKAEEILKHALEYLSSAE